MAHVVSYHRPDSLEGAVELVGRGSASVLAGGTMLNAERSPDPVEAVDLQTLALDRIERWTDGRLMLGAMVRLQALADDPRVPSVIRESARRELPSTLRAAATVGGSVCAAGPESELLAALLVHDAIVLMVGPDGRHEAPLPAVLTDRTLVAHRIITAVAIATGGDAAAERVARTAADRPIVAAVARRSEQGELRMALAGVAATPVLLGAGGATALDPPGDHRGSPRYRLALAAILCRRLEKELVS
jgi:probable selenate reductase FAD-binding subunit